MTDLDALLRGDPPAWDAFAADQLPALHRAVRATLRRYGAPASDEVVEDLAQDVLLKLVRDDFRLLRRYDPLRAAMVTWLALIARSTAIDYLRRASLRIEPLDHAAEAAAAPAPEIVEPLQLPVELLSPRQRLVLQLSFDEGLSVEEIARQLAIDPQTVRSTRHKALERLRTHFAARGDAGGMGAV